MKFVFLLAIVLVVSLGVATQYADASSLNERVESVSGAITVGSTIYHNSSPIDLKFTFDGVGGARVTHPHFQDIGVINGVIVNHIVVETSVNSFSYNYRVIPSSDGTVTVIYPANSFTLNGVSNDAVTYSFIYDSTDPTLGSADLATVKLTVGDTAPTVPQIRCNDANARSTNADRSAQEVDTTTAGDTTIRFTCVDKAGNQVEVTKLYKVVALTNISIASDNAYDTSLAGYGDRVTVTFDLATGSTFTGNISSDNERRDISYNTDGNIGTMTKTLTGNEDQDLQLPFSLVITDSDGDVKTYTAVQGTGAGTSVTADFIRPDTPTYISIASDNARDTSLAKSGDIVTVTFDTDTDATETKGTIGGKNANYTLVGTIGKLTRTLDGTESLGDLAFSFRIFDHVGNSGALQSAVKGTGSGTSVTTDFTAPAASTYISIASDNARDTSLAKKGDIVTITFDTDEGSTVKEGTIGGGTATFTFNGTSSTLTRTLNGTETEGSPLVFSFVQTDDTGNAAATQTAVKGTGSTTSVTADFTAPAVPAHIFIESDNNYDTSFARSGDIVTLTFDLATNATFTGSIGDDDGDHWYDTVGHLLLFDAISNNTGTIIKVLSGDENANDLITFSLVIIDAAGNAAETQTAVKGIGAGTSVTTDFIYPVTPDNISIAHDGAGTDAVLGDTVTVTFDTDTDATRTIGTIGGENVTYTLDGTTGKLARTLDGTESPGVLAFAFRVFDYVGNGGATTQTVVKGAGAGTSVTTDFVAPAVPTYISIESDNADPTKAKKGDIVTITFDTEDGSTVAGTIGGKNATFTSAGNSSTLAITLNGTETKGLLTFSFVQTNIIGSTVSQTEVKGTGADTFVIADFRAPAIPTNILIESDNADPTKAKLGDTVTITFDTEADSTVIGTIDGKPADFVYAGAFSTLTRVLNGTETQGSHLTFSFVQTDPTGNDSHPRISVRGDSFRTSVTADFVAPVVTYAGATSVSVNQNDSYTLPDMTCEDAVDGNSALTPPVTFHTDQVGVNTIYYQCSDAAGNESARFAYTVTVVQVTPPVSTTTILRAENGANATQSISLELTGKHPIYLAQGATYTAPTLSCIDNTTGSDVRSTPTLLSSSDTVDSATLGDYTQHYSCTGTQGTNNYDVAVNVFDSAKIHEIRSGDDVLFLNTTASNSASYSTAPLTMTFHGYASLESVISLYDDTTSQSLPVMTTILATANLDVGHLEYVFTPTSGANPHISIHVDGFPQVDDDYSLAQDSTISSPTLTLNGDAVMSLEKDAAFTDPGASCSDPEDGTLTVSTAGSVDNTAVGLYNLSYTCTDSDGHVDTEYRSVYYITDTTAPAVPIFTTLPTTVSTTPITLAGTAEADSTVTLYKGESVVDTATATSGTFEFAGVTLDEERNSFTATATDAALNVSAKSGALVITLDTAAPVAPIFTNSTTTVSSSPVTLAGTAEADSTVTLYKDETFVATATATGGAFEFTGVELDEERNSFTATATDASSNVSAKSGALVITLDTTAPVFATSTDTTDVTFGDTVPTLSALCTDANTITVTNDAGSITFDAVGAKTVIYTCTDAAGNTAIQSVSYSVAAAPSTFNERASSSTSKTVVDGTIYHNLGLVWVEFDFTGDGTSVDRPRSSNIIVTNGVMLSASNSGTNGTSSFYHQYFVQPSSDGTVTVTYPANSFIINGASNDAVTYTFVSDRTHPTFEAGADFSTVELTVGDDFPTLSTLQCRDTYISTTSAPPSGSVNANLAGDYPVEYTCTDNADNSVTKTKTYRVLADFAAPAAPIFTNSTTTVSSSPVTLAGTAEADSTVTLYKDETFVATATATGGAFEFTGVELDEERNSFTATATDAALNVSAKSGALVITLDTAAPAAPIFTNSTATVSSSPVTLAGTAEADSTVTLYKDETSVATATATGGIFEFAGVTLAEERNSFTATATDAALNVSAKSGALVITLDTAAPAAPIFTNSTATVSSSPVTLAGTAEADSTVTLYKGETFVATATTTGGIFEFAGVTLAEERNSFTATATDAALNVSAKSGALVITLDTAAPAAPIFTNSTATVSSSPVTLAGTAEADSVITLYKGETFVATATATGGIFEFAGVELDEERNSFTATATDAALNVSVKSGALVITLDTAAPAAPIFTNSTTTVSSSPVTLAGTAEADSVITLYKGESVVATATATGGDFEFAGVTLAEERNSFTATATDAALNVSAKSGALVITLDTAAPAAPIFTNSTATVSSSPVTLAGTAEADSVITLYKGESVVATATATGGDFEFAGVTLDEERNSFTATATDAALNVSVKSGALVITLDTAAPAAPIFTNSTATVSSSPVTLAGTAEADSVITLYKGESVVATATATGGIFEFAGVTLAEERNSFTATATDAALNVSVKSGALVITLDTAAPAAPIFTNSTATVSSSPVTLAGTAEADSTVTLYKDETSVATATATGGIFEFAGVTLAEERNSFTATATDAALNVSAKSGALVITLDTAAPAAPIFTNSTATVSSSPVTLAGTAEADSVITLYKGESVVATATATGGDFEFAGVTLDEERNSFTATATDAALNVSAKSGALVITLDTAAPAAPIFTNSTTTVSSSPVTLAGTAEADSVITLYKGESVVATATATGGIFEFAGVTLDEERNSFTATATDAALNVSAKSGALVITLDTAAPAAPIFTNSTATVSSSPVTLAGTAEADSTVTLYKDETSVATATATGGIFEFAGVTLAEERNSFTATATDAALNVSAKSGALVITLDTAAPAAPIFTNSTATVSSSPVTLAGTAEADSTVTLYKDETSVATATATGGIFEFAGVTLAEERNSFTATATDAALNVSAKSGALVITLDTAAPAAPIFTNSTATVSSSPVTLAGTAEADSTVTLYKDETSVATATATGGIFEFAGVTLDEERNSFTATATDAALNVSAKSGALVITLDTAAPAAPIFTNSTTTVSSSPVTLAGTAEADSTVTLYKGETSVATATATGGIFEFAGVTLDEERNSFTATATDAALNVSAKSGALVITLDTAAPAAPIFTNSTATVSSSPVTLAGTAEADSTVTLYKDETSVATATATGGIFEFAGVTLAEERNSFTATATDAALNVSAKSGALVITLDTAAPAAPIFTNSTATVSSSPVTLAGTAEADSTVTLYKDETSVATATATGGIFEFAGVTLAEERNSFTATATDAALNVSAKSGALVITLDTAAPAAPIFTNSTATVSSSPVTLAGTAEADSTVTLYKDETSVATATATGGIFEFAGVTLAEERNSFTATATDAALNVSAKSGALVITLDTAAPAAPIFTNSTATVSSSPVTLAGTAEADSVITLYKGESVVATATATGGIFEFAGVTLAEERNSFTATATDAALNVSAKSGALVITLDTAAPAAPIFTNSTATVSSSPVTLAGTAEADSTVTLYKDETSVATATATGGIFEFAGVTLAEERNSFTATATDAALNVSAKSGALVITLDTAAPAAPIFTNSTATVSSSPVTLAGTAEADSTVTLYKDETSVATATATGGIFEFAGVTLAEERNSFTATATDAALNVSAKSGALVITLDTAAPAAPIFTNSTATVSSSPVTLAGTAEADSTVTLYKDETSVATATATGGIFEFAGVTLAEERNSFTATATDAALNVSAKSGALVITLDTAAPAAPIFTNSTATVSSSPVTLAGTAEADSTVTLYKGETSVATATATGGIFEFAGVELDEGSNDFTATATDAALNVSAKSGALVITLDTAAPIITVDPLEVTLELDSASPTLLDGVSTDDGSTVTTTGTVDVSTVDDYTIRYDSTDGTNAATTVTRTYHVTDTKAPIITVDPLEVTLELDSASPTLLDGVSTDDGSTVTTTGTVDVSTVDDYTIRYDSTDGTNAATTVTRTYHVTDTKAPIITVDPLEVTLELNSASPTLLDGVSTDDGSTVTTTGTVDVSTVDDYTIRYDSTDGTNAATTVTRTYHVTDTKAPIITVDPLEVTLELDSASPTLLDGVSTDDGSTVTTTGTVDVSTVDDYTIRYDSTDGTNAATTVTRTYHVTDTKAPIITVDPLEVTLELDSASPTLLDGVSTDDGSTVTTTGTVDVSTVDDYTIRYDSTDGTNAATTVTRTYHVTDTKAPIITVDPLEVTLELDSASPTLLDGVSTDDGSTVTTTGTVDVSTVDDYTIRYDSTDGTNAATTVTRTYHVTDTKAPIITVDPLEVTLELDSASPTLLDGVSTDDGSTVTTTGTVDVSTVDDYTIRYDSTDGTNAATTVTRTYHVTDTKAPIITVDPLEVTLELDSASPTLLDGVSTDDGSTVTTTGTVDVSTVDDYTIRYDSTDGTNAATTVTRTYHVTDTKAPIITVDPLEVTLELDSASPTLLDGVSTDDGSTVTTTGTVDVSTVDDYTIRYDSTDGTNAATTVTRTYHVTDTKAPIITVDPLEVTLELDSASPTLLDGVSTDDGSTVTTTGTVDVSTVDDYTIRYDSTDGTNAATTVTRTYHVTDTKAPIITVDPLEVTLELDSASPTLLDGVSTDDGSTVTTTGTVDVSTVDDYTIRYDSTDGTNAATTVTRTYHVTDTKAPIITVDPLEVTLELDSASPTLLDGVSTDDGSTVTTTGTVDVSTVDDYTIRYDSTDGTNAATTVTRTYHVTDTKAPIITVDPLEVTLELDSASPTLLDGVSTDDGSTVTTTGTVDVSTVDDYTIRYDSTDGTNAATTVTRTYHVTDTKAPIITVDPLEVTLELDSASPTLLDGVSTDDGSTVTTTGTVDVSTVDDYTIRYDSTDGTNAATTVTRTYHVTDTKAPIITVDPLEVTLELDSASPTLLDGVSTDDGSTVTTTGTVDVSTVDDYTIRYDSTDGTNAATTVTRTYHVTDTKAPIITVDPLEVTLELDSASPTLLDGVSTDDGSTVTTTGTVDVSTVDDYTIRYDSTDGTNAATTVTRTYHVTDTKAPIITVDPLEVTLELDSASPTLLDGVSTDDGSTVTTTGTVDVSTVDDYTIRYDSTDGTNAATTVTRTYHVTDTKAPIITVDPLEVTLELDSASPTLLDGVSTDDGSTVTTTGTVDVSTVDDYTIRYDSTDGTNAATTVTRTYHVTDTKAPIITVDPLEVTLELDSASPTLLDGVSTDDGSTVTTTGTVDVSTVDDYTIRYDSTDGTNAATTVTRTYHVTDTKAPIITVDPLEVTLELDSASPTLLDGVSTDDGSTVTTTGTVDVSTVDDYTIRYDSTDGTNAATTVTRTYHVTDTKAPIITVDPLEVTLELDSASPTLLDGVSTDDGSTVTTTGTVDVSTVDDYTIRYDSTDGTNAATTVTRTYHVTDTKAPIITVDPLEVTLELDSASPTLLDGVSTDDGSTVTTTGTVDVSTVDDYTIRYDSTDGTNAATTVTRTYHVTDTKAPIITVDPLEVTLELDSASPTLLDGVSTDDGSTVTTTGTVDVSTVDDYTIRYDSTDGTNAATTVTRTYHVTDTKAPIITVDPLEVTLELDSASPTLLDGVSTDDGSTVTTTGTVDVSTVDDYTIRYDSTDGTNAATTVTRTYHVTDTKAPIITVDPLEVTLELDSASPTLLDGVSTDDGSTVTTTGTVDVSTVDDYTIRYDSTDGTNAATTVTRTYHVTDTKAPIITVDPLEVTLELDSASPTLLDGVSTDDGSTVTTTGTVDVSTVDDYTIRYDSTDGTNAATTVTRTYHVTDTKAPAIPVFTNSTATVSSSPVTLAGTAEADSTVTLYKDETSVATATATGGIFEFAGVTLAEERNSFTATATDAALNVSAKSGALVITLDTAAPAAPIFTNSTTTVSSSPVTLAGTAEADSTVTLYKDETSVATATATGGIFEFAGVTLAEERNSFTATATDAALNVSAKSGALVITLDTAAPVFTDTSTAATAKVGDVIPTLTCTDPGGGRTFVFQTIYGNFDTAVSTSVTYTCTDVVDQETVQTVVYDVAAIPPAVPTDISIASDNADDTKAKSGDIVTVTFDTVADSTVKGTIGGKNATFAFNGTSSTLARTLDGTETSGVLTFSFVQSNTGVDAATQTAVKGAGARTSVTADFTKPVITPHTNNPVFATIGDPYTIPTLTCTDNLTPDKGATPSTISIDTASASSHTVTYSCTDDTRNAAVDYVLTVNVVALPTTSVEITPIPYHKTNIGTYSFTIILGDDATGFDPTTDVTLSDGGRVDSFSEISGTQYTVNTADYAQGAVTITLQADAFTDFSNAETSYLFTYDTTKPVIVYAGDNPVSVNQDADYDIPSLDCTDNIDTTKKAQSSGTVDTGTVADHTINYSCIDLAGNTATPLALVVNVITTPAIPVIITPPSTSTTMPRDTDLPVMWFTSSESHYDIYQNQPFVIPDDLNCHDAEDGTLPVSTDSIWLYDREVGLVNNYYEISKPYVFDDFDTSKVTVIYEINYICTDSDGNTGIDRDRFYKDGAEIKFTAFAKIVPTPSEPADPPKKKKGDGSNDWHKKPTFGKNHLTHKQIIDNGFTFNDYSLTITDNWHTDFVKTSSIIGDTNTVKIKTYAADPLKWINLYLGVPRLGHISDAESEIHLVVSRDYSNPVGYTIDEINHYQDEGLVNVDDTTASLQKAKCQASDNDEKCYEFSIDFTVMAPLHEEVVAISAMDDKRRQHVTYINEGVEFTGESLLDAHTAKLMQKKTNQGQAEIIELIQQDRRYNVWEDQHGYLWTLNEYGTWTQITAAEFKRHQDGTGNVMTRQNSNFASLIEQERQKALLVFDSGDLISELDDYFAYDYSNVTSDMSKLEKYAYELQLESERAQKYIADPYN